MPLFFCLGFLGICGYHFFFFSSLGLTSVTNTAIINAVSPVITAVLAGLFVREQLNGRNYLGLFLAVIGVILLLTEGRPDVLFSWRINRGDGLMLLAVFCWAGYAILLKGLTSRYSTYTLTLYAAVAGVAQLLILVIFENPVLQLKHISIVTLGGLVYMGIVASGLGYLCYNRSVRDLGPTRTASLVYSLVPLLVVVLAHIFFGESPSVATALSGGLILVGLNLVLKR